MFAFECTTRWREWQARWKRQRAESAGPLGLMRPELSELASWPEEALPLLVRQSPVALRYRQLLGDLAWSDFPERPINRAWPGPEPALRAPYVAAFLVKLEEGLRYMSELRTFLVEHPALVWLLGFALAADDSCWGFDVAASVPSRKQLGRVLRTLSTEQVRFLLGSSVRLLDEELPPALGFGREVSVDTKHIVGWVKENNPKVRLRDRFDKTKQPKGDPDCRVGFKAGGNRGSARGDTQERSPATAQQKEGAYYWGYASGVVATKLDGWGEFVLAELTQPFDRSDHSYFLPLMAQTEAHLGRKPPFGALDGGFDAFFVHQYFYEAGGMAAVPWADQPGHRKRFSDEGLPLCEAGLAMPRKSTFQKRSHCLVPHECARYACPLRTPEPSGEPCPIGHANDRKQGCLTTLPTAAGCRVRHELDRESAAYKQLYRQRTATERINSQATELGIERPKLRNGRAIANQNTLLYVLINLRALRRVRLRKAALTADAG